MELRRPTLEDRNAVLEMVQEFEAEHSAHDGGFWEEGQFDYDDWIATNQDLEMGLNIPNGWVPSIQFVGFIGEKAVGFLSLRLRLNDYLSQQGGHIGYSIRPSERRKGYAKKMLTLALIEARKKGINQVLISCDSQNEASRKTILANDGVYEDTRKSTERYWIEVSDEQSKTTRMEE